MPIASFEIFSFNTSNSKRLILVQLFILLGVALSLVSAQVSSSLFNATQVSPSISSHSGTTASVLSSSSSFISAPESPSISSYPATTASVLSSDSSFTETSISSSKAGLPATTLVSQVNLSGTSMSGSSSTAPLIGMTTEFSPTEQSDFATAVSTSRSILQLMASPVSSSTNAFHGLTTSISISMSYALPPLGVHSTVSKSSPRVAFPQTIDSSPSVLPTTYAVVGSISPSMASRSTTQPTVVSTSTAG